MTSILALCAAALIGTCLLAGIQTTDQLSSQGCRMSYMSPSYILQDTFNQSWTPLARRYSLWLYREVPWEHEVNIEPCQTINQSYNSFLSLATWSTSLVYTWARRIVWSSSLHRVLLHPPVLLRARRTHTQTSIQGSRLLCSRSQ